MKNIKETLGKQKESILSVIGPSMPSLTLSEDDIPELKKWKVGKTYNLEIEVKQKSMHQDPKGKMSGNFEVISVEVCEPGQSDD